MTPEGFPETQEEYEQFLEEMNEWSEQLKAQQAQQQQPQSSGDQGGPSMSFDIMDMFGGGTAGAGAGGSSSVAGGPGGVGGGTSSFFAGEGAAGGGSAATSNPYGAIAALIAAIGYGQSKATGGNKREIEGQKTGDWFEGGSLQDRSPMTEPWFAALREKWGLSATAGEKFDAAWKNKDWGNVAKRLPAAADYWADPIRKWISTGTEKGVGKVAGKGAGKLAGKITDPIGMILGLFGK